MTEIKKIFNREVIQMNKKEEAIDMLKQTIEKWKGDEPDWKNIQKYVEPESCIFCNAYYLYTISHCEGCLFDNKKNSNGRTPGCGKEYPTYTKFGDINKEYFLASVTDFPRPWELRFREWIWCIEDYITRKKSIPKLKRELRILFKEIQKGLDLILEIIESLPEERFENQGIFPEIWEENLRKIKGFKNG